MCTTILPECVSAHCRQTWYQWRLEEGIRNPGTRMTQTQVCELPCGCWESNLGPLQMVLTSELALTKGFLSPMLIHEEHWKGFV